MLTVLFVDYTFLMSFLVVICGNWLFFFKSNQAVILIKPSKFDARLVKTNILKKVNFFNFLKFIILSLVLLLSVIVTLQTTNHTFFFDHLIITQVNIRIIFFFILLSLFISILVHYISFSKININIDFFFAFSNLIYFVPLIFLANTFLTLFFFLELSSCLIFYKFLNSRFFYKNTRNSNKILEKFNKNLPKNFLNVLFFQYWVTFFSSVLLLLFIIQFIEIFASSEWAFLNLYNSILLNLNLMDNYVIYILIGIFIIGFFFKIGITPIHLFKIEVYKGIPFFTIFFYTTFYFFIYFFFFVYLILNNFFTFNIYIVFNILLFLVIGTFYTISLLFDINLIKMFFAYSTIINSLIFLNILVISII